MARRFCMGMVSYGSKELGGPCQLMGKTRNRPRIGWNPPQLAAPWLSYPRRYLPEEIERPAA